MVTKEQQKEAKMLIREYDLERRREERRKTLCRPCASFALFAYFFSAFVSIVVLDA